MNTLAPNDLETRIADVAVAITTHAKSNQKKRLRSALAELAALKSQRSMSVIHRLDVENGLEDLV